MDVLQTVMVAPILPSIINSGAAMMTVQIARGLKIFPAPFLHSTGKSEIQKRISGQWRNIQACCFDTRHSILFLL
jgi:hypothetical protein